MLSEEKYSFDEAPKISIKEDGIWRIFAITRFTFSPEDPGCMNPPDRAYPPEPAEFWVEEAFEVYGAEENQLPIQDETLDKLNEEWSKEVFEQLSDFGAELEAGSYDDYWDNKFERNRVDG